MKVGYVAIDGYESTAYLDEAAVSEGRCSGVDKYTDDPLTVEWDGEAWHEVQPAP